MTQPKFAPIAIGDEVRPSFKLDPPKPWVPHRPGEHRPGALSRRPGTGAQGPDQGYALRLVERFEDRLVLGRGEHVEDALAAGVAVGLRRASIFGRAPVSTDIEVGLAIFGYLDPSEPDVVAARRRVVLGAAHDDWCRMRCADLVPEGALRAGLADARSHAVDWLALEGN